MRPSLKIRDLLDQYQHKLQLDFTSREVGLDREIKLSRQTADTFDAAEDLIARQNRAIARNFGPSG